MSIESIILFVIIVWAILSCVILVVSFFYNEVFLAFDKEWHQWFVVFYIIKTGCEDDINLAGQIILQILGHIWFLPVVVLVLVVMMLVHLACGMVWVFKKVFGKKERGRKPRKGNEAPG